MDEVFDVFEFSEDLFKSLLASSGITQPSVKRQISYLNGYLADISAKTIVVEYSYIDHDYLEDYAEYYVRCFKEYKRNCQRLHFFSTTFDTENFLSLSRDQHDEEKTLDLQTAYLGFIVLKPLPQTMIGRTCLATYPHNGRRYFPVTRKYSVNLFGIDLEVNKSLAFQEQDTAVAACATSALWSAFHSTGVSFQHAIPSPSQITKAATEHLTRDNRAFPSEGLTSIEMARAIKSVGLEPTLVGAQDMYILKSTIFAYLKAEIPMILGVDLYDIDENDQPKLKGKHAITITGFSLREHGDTNQQGYNIKLLSSSMDKIYAHDDRVGPFSKMEFNLLPLNLDAGNGQMVKLPTLSTEWPSEHPEGGKVVAVPDILMVPLYHKIRIQFGTVHDYLWELDKIFKILLEGNIDLMPTDGFEWSIHLTTVNKYKKGLSQSNHFPNKSKNETLFASLPKYIWVASADSLTQPAIDLIFDGTDLDQGIYFVRAIVSNPNLSDYLQILLSSGVILTHIEKSKSYEVIRWLVENQCN